MEKRTISIEIYNKVISQIPKAIINMLPEEPIKLLPYAQRVKEISFSSDIKDDLKELMKKHLLSDEEYLKTFYYVMAITFYNKRKVENPEIAVVAAQTGSGKSNLTAKLLRKNENYIFVDSDKYKHFRYDAQEIAEKYPNEYPALTGPDGYDHADNIYRYAVENNYNIIKETAPSANKGLLGIDVKDVLKYNYKITVHILAVGELNSLLSTHERYELQIIYGLKTCKLTGINRHDESYNSLIKNVEDIMKDNNVYSISIYKRGIKEEKYDPILVYPTNKFNSPIDAIESVRLEDNEKTKNEFKERYNWIIKQMEKRDATSSQYNQIEKIRKRLNV